MKKLKVKNEKMHTNQVKLHQKKWLIMNDEFHELIYSNCGSPIVSNLVHQARLRIYRFRLLRTELESIELYNQQHDMLLEAISERNGKKAEKLAIKHLNLAKKNRLKALKDFGELI
jgi:DNA-binding GntR family transcriptional regulator